MDCNESVNCGGSALKTIGTEDENGLIVISKEPVKADSSSMELRPKPPPHLSSVDIIPLVDQYDDPENIVDKFSMIANELENWIGERTQMCNNQSISDLQSEIEKHEAFEAELIAQMKTIKVLECLAVELARERHQNQLLIETRLDYVRELSRVLLARFAKKGLVLKETTMFNQFQELCDRLEAWIKDKEVIIGVCEFGVQAEDLKSLQLRMEKCVELQKEMNIHERGLVEMNNQADTLISYGSENRQGIEEKREEVSGHWKILKQAVEGIVKSLEIQKFNMIVDETMDFIDLKTKKLSDNVVGKDLHALICETVGLEEDIVRIQHRVNMIGSETERLRQIDVYHADEISKEYEKICKKWDCQQFYKKLQMRKLELQERFVSEYHQLLNWMSVMTKEIRGDKIPSDINGTKYLLERYESRKQMIEKKGRMFKELNDIGQSLVKNMHFASSELAENMNSLEEAKRELELAWTSGKALFTEYLEFQVEFKECMAKYR